MGGKIVKFDIIGLLVVFSVGGCVNFLWLVVMDSDCDDV